MAALGPVPNRTNHIRSSFDASSIAESRLQLYMVSGGYSQIASHWRRSISGRAMRTTDLPKLGPWRSHPQIAVALVDPLPSRIVHPLRDVRVLRDLGTVHRSAAAAMMKPSTMAPLVRADHALLIVLRVGPLVAVALHQSASARARSLLAGFLTRDLPINVPNVDTLV